jgi:hypothetical protein
MKSTTIETVDLAGYLSKVSDHTLYGIEDFIKAMLKGEKKGEYKALETVLNGIKYEVIVRRFRV